MQTQKCKSCGALIFFARTGYGKLMPIEAQPCPEGNVVIEEGMAMVIRDGIDLFEDRPRYKSHFATCPNAAQHRRGPQ